MAASVETIDRLNLMAKRMRVHAIELAYQAGKNGAHLGGGLSAIEILAVLYGSVMHLSKPLLQDPNRDRFLLSKGHGTLAYYPALLEAGLITREQLFTFEQNGGNFPGQPVRNLAVGIEASGGSLGMGLSIGVGMAIAAKMQNRENRIYVLLGDGECNEGSVWEAAMSAVSYKLSNLIAIVDKNDLQSDGRCQDVLHTESLCRMWEGFGWHVVSADGHSVQALCQAFDACMGAEKPSVLIADTRKGKGVSFMEDNRLWHHGVLSKEQYQQALQEVSHA